MISKALVEPGVDAATFEELLLTITPEQARILSKLVREELK